MLKSVWLYSIVAGWHVAFCIWHFFHAAFAVWFWMECILYYNQPVSRYRHPQPSIEYEAYVSTFQDGMTSNLYQTTSSNLTSKLVCHRHLCLWFIDLCPTPKPNFLRYLYRTTRKRFSTMKSEVFLGRKNSLLTWWSQPARKKRRSGRGMFVIPWLTSWYQFEQIPEDGTENYLETPTFQSGLWSYLQCYER